MAKNKKSKRGNLWSKILVVTMIEVVLIVGVMIGAFVLVLDPFSGNERETTQSAGEDTTRENPAFSHEGSESISVTYVGGRVYAGGQVRPEDFEVLLHFKDGSSREVTGYDSIILTDTYRLEEGDNTIAFYYGGFWANTTVYAVSVSELLYLPSYVTKSADEQAVQELIDRIDRGELGYREALADVAFTGDSQIAALSAFGILPQSQVLAKVGESLNYMEQNLDGIIDMSWDKKALVVHYGINTLSTSEEGRVSAVERYKSLLLRLKEALPNTRIIVSGLFPVADTIYYDQQRFAYINDYNLRLFEMCCEIGIDYLSDSEYIATHQEYFQGDGLHLKKDFYVEYWLKNLIATMGI